MSMMQLNSAGESFWEIDNRQSYVLLWAVVCDNYKT